MEGPGGYQLVGRTVPVWSRHRPFRQTTPDKPWLLDFFDRLRFHLVSPEELLELRADLVAGRAEVGIEEGRFDLHAHHAFLAEHATGIRTAQERQRAAFAAERARWQADGELDRARKADRSLASRPPPTAGPPPGLARVVSPLTAAVWKLECAPGQTVRAGDRLAVLEAMKMELPVVAASAGTVRWVGCAPGQMVQAGQPLFGLGE
jgi:urea carboxylase